MGVEVGVDVAVGVSVGVAVDVGKGVTVAAGVTVTAVGTTASGSCVGTMGTGCAHPANQSSSIQTGKNRLALTLQ